MLDGPHHCQQFIVLSTANNLTWLEEVPVLWLVIIFDVDYSQILINVRPEVVDDEGKTKLTFVVHHEQMVIVVSVRVSEVWDPLSTIEMDMLC